MAHARISFDPNEQTNLRYRLFARAIRLNGIAQLESLEPYLRARLEQSLTKEIDLQLTDGIAELLDKH